MKKSRILFRPTLFLSLFALLILSVQMTDSKEPAYEEALETEIPVPSLNPEEIKLYNLRQEALETELAIYFKNAINKGLVLGTGISIIKGDSLLFNGGYGVRHITNHGNVDGETVFRLGSLSKGFAGVLSACLASEEKLDLSGKVSDYVPNFQFGTKEHSDKVTLKTILSHTSGTAYHSYTDLVESGIPLSKIAPRFQKVRPISEPGALYSYQNAMFALCGEAITAATNKSIEQNLSDRFFKPLGMTTTTTNHKSLSNQKNVALPHRLSSGRFKALNLTDKYYNAVAAGGINASALDMAKWMGMLLGHQPKVANQSNFESAFSPVVEIKGSNKYYQKWPGHVSSHYGFGWRIHKYVDSGVDLEKTIWHHGGSVNNYRNEIALYPDEDLGICVLFNSNTSLAKTVVPDIHKIVNDIFSRPLSSFGTPETFLD